MALTRGETDAFFVFRGTTGAGLVSSSEAEHRSITSVGTVIVPLARLAIFRVDKLELEPLFIRDPRDFDRLSPSAVSVGGSGVAARAALGSGRPEAVRNLGDDRVAVAIVLAPLFTLLVVRDRRPIFGVSTVRVEPSALLEVDSTSGEREASLDDREGPEVERDELGAGRVTFVFMEADIGVAADKEDEGAEDGTSDGEERSVDCAEDLLLGPLESMGTSSTSSSSDSDNTSIGSAGTDRLALCVRVGTVWVKNPANRSTFSPLATKPFFSAARCVLSACLASLASACTFLASWFLSQVSTSFGHASRTRYSGSQARFSSFGAVADWVAATRSLSSGSTRVRPSLSRCSGGRYLGSIRHPCVALITRSANRDWLYTMRSSLISPSTGSGLVLLISRLECDMSCTGADDRARAKRTGRTDVEPSFDDDPMPTECTDEAR